MTNVSHPMVAIRYITEPLKRRVETGPVQFMGDWPGVFIRGDEALATADAMSRLDLRGLETRDFIDRLATLLRSCRVETKDK